METKTGIRTRWTAAYRSLWRPVDIASLAAFRVMFGAVMLWETARYFDAGWIEEYWIEPQFNFTYWGFSWVAPWGGDGMYYHWLAIGVLSFCVMIGFLYRAAAALLFLTFTYTFLLEEARYLNHFYLACLVCFIMPWLPAHGTASVDARLGLCRPSDRAPAWAVGLLPFQMGLVYFYGGVAKLNGDWLRGEPIRAWLHKRNDYPIIGPLYDQEAVVALFAYGGALYDLLIAPLLLWKRTRRWALAATLFFHLNNKLLFDIGIFPWFSLALTTLFLSPDWPRRFFVFPPAPAGGPASFKPNAALAAGLGVYAAWQILMPLRHWLYPGNVHWTEEGHRWSWRMKLRSKSGTALFVVEDLDTREQWIVDPEERLMDWQASAMANRPEMILEFAHFLAQEKRGQGRENIAVRVRSRVRLNGRPAQTMIDPDANLADMKDGLGHKDWITPLTTPLKITKR